MSGQPVTVVCICCSITYLHVTALICVDLSTERLLNLGDVQVLLDALQNGVAKVATYLFKGKRK
jgi:hypothetical protein